MNIVLYTTHCPKCTVLKKKLDNKKIQYDIVQDIEKINEKGYTSMPVLQIDDKPLSFEQSVKYVNSL